MDNIVFWVGEGEHLNALQMSIRAIGMFFITLLLIKIGGIRIFGHGSAFDSILVIMLGAILARGVVGASPYLSTIAAAASMTVIHRILGLMATRSKTLGNFIKGKHIPLYQDNKFLWDNMDKCSISEGDVLESLRLQSNQESLKNVERAIMETNGHISFLIKKAE